jgi:glycine betaine/proline transport system substrate-binding protein
MIGKFRAAAFVGALLSAAALVAAPAVGEVPESKDPIKVAINDWSSQLVTARIVGGMFERMGYKVEYIQADAMAQFAGLETGDIHIQTEIWPTTQGDRFNASLATGNVLDMGELGTFAIEDWWYPLYMKEYCPTLPDWHALLEEDCAEAFSSIETAPLGRYLGGPAQWEGFDEERVEALGLPFEVVHAGSDAAMWAELESGYNRTGPVLQWVWVPHWWPVKYEGEFVDFPPYTPECYEDPSWGVNPDLAYDCAKPRGMMHKAAWASGESKWTGAWNAFRNYVMDQDTYAVLITQIELEGGDVEDVANQWLDENSDTWKAWWY